MDIKFLDEKDSYEDKSKGNHKIIYLVFTVIIVIGICFLCIEPNQHDSIAADVPSSSNLPSVSQNLAEQQSSQRENTVLSSAASSSVVSSQKAETFQQSNDWKLLLVNSKLKIPDNLNPQIVRYDNVQMDKRILPYFLQMKAAAAKDGITLWLSGGYRSMEEQQKLFERTVQGYIKKGLSQSDAEKEARKVVAEPGYSEHNTGLALDFNGSRSDFVSTDAYAWLQKHAAEYGFVLRYPKEKKSITGIEFQPWFYRYVGAENAKKMNAENQCLEEFLNAPQAQ
jgi:zinc D-Ala-D-Ala carboxypeptidase